MTEKKKWRFQIFCAGVETVETYVLHLTPGRSKGTILVWKLVDSEIWWGKDVSEYYSGQCEDNQKLWPLRGSHTRHKHVKMKPANKHIRTTTENQEENSWSVSVLFLLMTCCFSYPVTQFSYAVSFSQWLL